MNEPIVPLPPRESLLRHRHEKIWQILVPVISTAIVGIIFAVIIVIGTIQGGEAATWASIATIILVAPIMVVSFLLLVILSFMIYGARLVYKNLPDYSGQALDAIYNVNAQVKYYADKSTAPILIIKTWLSVPGKMFHKE
jgi:hypothetical protein